MFDENESCVQMHMRFVSINLMTAELYSLFTTIVDPNESFVSLRLDPLKTSHDMTIKSCC